MSETVVVPLDGTALRGERWDANGPVVVMLHAAVADRRSWREVAEHLAGMATVVTYDRRGFGESAPSREPFSHLDDLLAVLDRVTDRAAWLVGASAGGRLALDAAVVAPECVAGLVLLAPGVSGAPTPQLDNDTQRLFTLLEQADAAGNLGEVNRIETWLWLDGPGAVEGRVSGPARSLAFDMNAIILRNGVPRGSGTADDVDAWGRLDEIQAPVTVACGNRDVPFLIGRSRELADRLPRGRYRVLRGTAHQPYLERPAGVAELVASALKAG
jgi:pimeloyl-ACP methyl ester carboxylesterase